MRKSPPLAAPSTVPDRLPNYGLDPRVTPVIFGDRLFLDFGNGVDLVPIANVAPSTASARYGHECTNQDWRTPGPPGCSSGSNSPIHAG